MAKEIKQYESLKSFLNSKDVDFEALGWSVCTGEKHILLYRHLHHHSERFLRVPDISIEFNEAYKTRMAEKLGPWLVKTKSLRLRRHTTPAKAIAYFIELAKLLAPVRPGTEA